MSRVAAAGVALIALGVLAGWWLQSEPLVSGLRGRVAMNPLTACCFLLASGALGLLAPPYPSRRRLRLGRALAGGLAALATLCLGRFVTPWDLHFDQLLFTARLAGAPGGVPNRMAPNTAFELLLLALAMLTLGLPSRGARRLGETAAIAAAGLGVAVLVGYVYHAPTLYGVRAHIPMALNTAVCFVALACAILCARPDTGLVALLTANGPGGELARRLLPATILLPVVLGWLHVDRRLADIAGVAETTMLMVALTSLVITILVYVSALQLHRADRLRLHAEARLRALAAALEERVTSRTADLGAANAALREEAAIREAAEAELTGQAAFLRQVMDATPALMFVTTADGRFTMVNQAVAELHGAPAEALLGEPATGLFAFDPQVSATGRMTIVSEESAPDPRSGEVRWFHVVRVPLSDPDGVARRMLGVCRDITLWHRDKMELRQVTQELGVLFESAPLAILRASRDGKVRSWNHAAELLFGWSADEVVGRLPLIIPPDRMREYQANHAAVLDGRAFAGRETQRLHRDGHLIDVSISAAPLYEETGESSGIVVIYLDITARKSLEAQFRQAQKMEAVGRLAGGVAHDFNNILTVVQTAAGFLLSDLDPSDPRRARVTEIDEAAGRAARLTHQLLAFSRRQVLQPRVVDINRLVADIEPMLRRLLEENIVVKTHLLDDLGPVQADPGQLEQVIMNLVVNARDAMPGGGTLLIETGNVMVDDEFPRTRQPVRPGAYVLLVVTDTGVGIDAETQARIFEPFFTTKPVGRGTGLGLSTVYGVVEQSGGHVWVYSEVGKGTTFKLYFPRFEGDIEVETRARPPAAAEPAHAPPNAGRAILVVEDDEAVRASVRRVLERHHYGVRAVSSGAEALASLATSAEVDLVLSDTVMPGMSGIELRQRVRAEHPGIPVLLMSGYSEEAITKLGDAGYGGPLLEKPFTIAGLLSKVREVLAEEAPDD